MKALLRLIFRIVSVSAHILTWVVSLAALGLVVIMAALVATGTRPIVVTTGSMVPVIPVGSIVLAHKVDATQIEIGDVVTVPLTPKTNVTHRVIKSEFKGSFTELSLKGDANQTPDPTTYKVTSALKMQAVMPWVGRLLIKAGSPMGLMVLGMMFGSLVFTFTARLNAIRKAANSDEVVQSVDTTPNDVPFVPPSDIAQRNSVPTRSMAERMQSEVDLRANELERQKGALITAVNHDLRTPLTSIMGYLELLTEGDFGAISDTQRNALSAVQRNADKLHGLVGNMLAAAQIEGGELHPSLGVEVDAAEILAKIEEKFASVAAERSISLDLVVAGNAGKVQGSVEQIRTCIDHLVSNAIKFTAEGGRVSLRAFNEAGLLTIAVSDTGIGIDARHMDHLFDSFYRTPQAEEHAVAGSGLGLAIVKAIVAAYDGLISVDSVPGIGSTFTVKFPTIERAKILTSGT